MSLKNRIIKVNYIFNALFVSFSVIMSVLLYFISEKTNLIVSDLESKDFEYWNVICAILLCVAYIIFDYLFNFFYRKSELRAEKEAKKFYLEKYYNLPISISENIDAGDLIFRITKLAPLIGSYYNSFFIMIGLDIVTLGTIFFVIMQYNWILSLIVFGCFVFLIIFTHLCSSKMAICEDQIETYESEENAFVTDSNSNILSIRNYFITTKMMHLYKKEILEKRYKTDKKKNVFYCLYIVTYDLIVLILPIIILLTGLFMAKQSLVTFGAVLAIFTLIGAIQDPLRNIADSISYFKDTRVRLKRFTVFEKDEQGNEDVDIKKIEILNNGINFYSPEKIVFEEGKNYLIHGESGVGKSTLFKIIFKEFDSISVSCKINDYDIFNVSTNSIYKQIIYVKQMPSLFNMSIRDNICLFSEIDENFFEEVIRLVNLDSFVQEYGLDRIIDFDEKNISGGEKEKIYLARALIRKPKFLLLDEILSSFDSENSNIIAKNLVGFSKKYNVNLIIISHKDEFDNFVENKILIEGGENYDKDN